MKPGPCANRVPENEEMQGSSNRRTPCLHHGNVGAEPAPCTIQSSGSVTALTAADPITTEGVSPRP